MRNPARLEWLIEMDKRIALSEELEKELYRLRAGDKGEHCVLDALQEFGETHWTILSNM